jgi:uncharacterized protein (TIGR04255 family)
MLVEPRVGIPWDESLTERVNERFPDFTVTERQTLTDHVWQLAPTGVDYKTTPRGDRIRRWNVDRTRLLQFGPTLCAYNALRPYQTFDTYMPQARDLFEIYLTLWRPQRILLLGQRYINAIRLPLGALGADYFEIYPSLPPAIRSSHPAVAVQVETGSFKNGTVTVNLVCQGLQDEHPSYVLDIYACSVESVSFGVDEVIAWQRQAHDAVVESFELSIKDASRELFQEVGP